MRSENDDYEGLRSIATSNRTDSPSDGGMSVDSKLLEVDDDTKYDFTLCFKKNSKKKLCKRVVMQKFHVNNASSKPYKVVVPRVLATDIRKHYSTMFFNLLNNADADLIALFFQKFTNCNTVVQNVLLPRPKENKRQTLQNPAFDQPLTQDFTTFHDITKFLEAMLLSIPDRVLTMKTAHVITRSNSFKTEIVVTLRCVAHKVFDLDPAELAAMLESMKQQLGGAENISEEHMITMMKGAFSPTPIPAVVEGRYVLIVNDYRESNKIDKIILETRPIKD
eukprot:gene13424-14764_t